jgi:hypothetical protein
MPARWWRLGALLVTASLVAASCSGSTPAAKVKHKHRAVQALAAPTTTTPSTTPSTTAPVATGNTGTGNTGNTGAGNTGAGNTGTGNSGSAPTTTAAPAVGGVTATSAPVFVITPSGKLKIRHMGPAIARFRPISSANGGTVIIMGRRLAHATAVTFDGIQATISANGSTKIKAVVPPGATSGPITVVTPYGSATVYGFVIT